ncbi:MAG: DUF3102 domain-containing protein [Treponema sp.]|jgi:hypothetical protein|nr:DUF3102 domain-containing protein [Treponema sp.]
MKRGALPREETALPVPVQPSAPAAFTDAAAAANALHNKFLAAMKKGAALAFEIGKLLREVWSQLEAGASWPDWCREHLAFDAGTANRYLRIYENFKDNPKALTGLTISGSLKLLAAPKREEPPGTEYDGADGQPELPWERYFEMPPLSRGVKLSNHRFEVPNEHEVYLIRRGLNYPVKIADVLVPADKRLKTAHRGMLEDVQAALERYYQEVERVDALEAKG